MASSKSSAGAVFVLFMLVALVAIPAFVNYRESLAHEKLAKELASRPRRPPDNVFAGINISTRGLTLGKMRLLFGGMGQPFKTHIARTVELGWECESNYSSSCACTAEFYSRDGNISDSAPPAKLTVEESYADDTGKKHFKGSINGVYLGDPGEKIAAIGRRGDHKISEDLRIPGTSRAEYSTIWNANWLVSWGVENGKITKMIYTNRQYRTCIVGQFPELGGCPHD